MRFKITIRNQEDFWAGLLFIGLGLLAIFVARDYPMGAAMRMGPGYFPTWLGAILAALVAMSSLMALQFDGPKVTRFAWRPVILLSVAFFVYGWAMDVLGFVPSLALLIFITSLAGQEFRLKDTLILMVGLITGAWVLFIWLLELPFPLFWWR